MARTISFSLTTRQIRDRSKTVTRRRGWSRLKVGDVLTACVKCMGLKRGERVERLASIRVVDVREERLDAITAGDVEREGFPGMTPGEFVAMFVGSMGGDGASIVRRIEFEYIDEAEG